MVENYLPRTPVELGLRLALRRGDYSMNWNQILSHPENARYAGDALLVDVDGETYWLSLTGTVHNLNTWEKTKLPTVPHKRLFAWYKREHGQTLFYEASLQFLD